MKKIILVIATLCSTLVACLTFAATQEPLNKIVAVVNDDVITQSELNKIVEQAKTQAEAQHAVLPDAAALQKDALDKLINKKLQLQLAKRAGVVIPEADINKTIEDIAKQNNLSVSEVYEHVAETGMSKTAYQQALRDQLTLQKLEQQQIGGRLRVSQNEITNYIRSQSWRNDKAQEYQLEDVLVPLSEVPTTQEIIDANDRAKTVMLKLQQGEVLQNLLQENTTGILPLQGGDLGFRKLAEIPELFAAQITRMQVNQVAGPIQAPNGFHIIKLVATRATANTSPPDRKQVETLLLEQKFLTETQNWVSTLRAQSFVKIYL